MPKNTDKTAMYQLFQSDYHDGDAAQLSIGAWKDVAKFSSNVSLPKSPSDGGLMPEVNYSNPPMPVDTPNLNSLAPQSIDIPILAAGKQSPLVPDNGEMWIVGDIAGGLLGRAFSARLIDEKYGSSSFSRGLAISLGIESAELLASEKLAKNHEFLSKLLKPNTAEAAMLSFAGSFGASNLKIRAGGIAMAWLAGRLVNAVENGYEDAIKK
jgi:hypothetical protein